MKLNRLRESWGRRMGRNALVVAASAAIFSACKNNNEQVPHLPANGTLSNLLPLSINKTDAEEIQNYGAFLDFYKVAEKELGIVLQNEKLGNIVGETASYDEMLPIFIKESRFIVDAKSRTGAIGYGQLQTGTIETVTRWLKNSGISKTYTPNTNPSDNLLYSTLYMSYLKNDVKKYFEGTDGQVNENELLLFAIASYNLGINKRKTLHTASGKVDTREKFARYLVKELMKLNGRGEKVTDDSYGVEYVNYFGDTDFSRDETIIFRNQGQYLHTLTKSKAQEVVRYVEIIIGLQQQLAKEQPAFDHIQIENNQLYAGIKNRLSQKEVSTAVKAGSTGNALINQILLDNGYTMKGVGTDTIYGVTVNAAIITPYLVDDAFKKYTYNVENYNKAEKRFLWSVVNELIQDNTFLKSLKELQIDTDRDDLKEEYSVIRQYALEAIVRFNQERRLNRSETSSDDVWIPEERYFHEYGRVRKIETNLVAQKEQEGKEAERITAQESQRLTTGKLYIDPKLDNLGEKIKEGATTFAVISIYNKQLVAAEEKHGRYQPTHIIIHGTETSRDNYHTAEGIIAHFYINYQGRIIQYGTSQTSSTTMAYPAKIIALNHAGVGNSRYGYSWEGNRQGTYRAIGIEVASSGTNRPNAAQLRALEQLITGLSTFYAIAQKNILTHQQVATSALYGRGRKSDLFGLEFGSIGLVNNHERLDLDVISGKVSPNMKAQVDVLKGRGMTRAEIEKVLSGLNTSILLCRKDAGARGKRMNKQDVDAWATLDELRKKGFL